MERSHLYGVIKKEIIRTLRRLKSVSGSDYTRLARQEQPRLNQAESDLQYIFLNGVAGIVARRQAEPKKYANNYNVHGTGGKFVKRQ